MLPPANTAPTFFAPVIVNVQKVVVNEEQRPRAGLTARVRVNTFRCGEHHLHLGEAAVAAEVGIAAIADVDAVLAGDLRD